jgi:hypothetical protein
MDKKSVKNSNMSGVEQTVFAMMEPALRERFKQEANENFRVAVEAGNFLGTGRDTLVRSMRISGSVADAVITGRSDFFDKLGCEAHIKLVRSAGRTWRIVEVENIMHLFDYYPQKGAEQRDQQLASMDAGKLACLITASKYDDRRMFDQLRREGANPTGALIVAADRSDRHGAITLLDHGADVNGTAAVPRHYCMFECQEKPLLAAINPVADDEIVNLFLSKGADVNGNSAYGMTPLMRAAQSGKPRIAKLLIEKGADPNARTAMGESALMYACEYGPHPEIAELLLQKGADLNYKHKITGETALSIAVSKQSHYRVLGLSRFEMDRANATIAALKRSGAH